MHWDIDGFIKTLQEVKEAQFSLRFLHMSSLLQLYVFCVIMTQAAGST